MPLTRGSGRTKSSIRPPLPRGFRIGTRTRAGSRPSTSRTLTEGPAETYGPEPERLNNVFGARLRITALRAGAGPGVELLEYLAPGGGRPMPAGGRPNHL